MAEVPLILNEEPVSNLVYAHLMNRLPTENTSKFPCPCEKNKKKFCEFDCAGNKSFNRECPASCSKMCTNRRIAKGVVMPLLKKELFKGVGYGVVAKEEILPNQFIGEYIGIVKDKAQYLRECSSNPSDYCMFMDDDMNFIVDAQNYGNLTRFIAHSCMPNVKSQKWFSDDGLPHLMIEAIRRIEKDEQLTYDYDIELRKGAGRMKCNCQKVTCIDNPKVAAKQPNTHKCHQCSKTFTAKKSLLRHNREAHEKETDNKCQECGMEFKRYSHLTRHEETHSSSREKNFKCHKCPKAFYELWHKKRHLEDHKKKKGAFMCQVPKNNRSCKKTFKTNESVKRHRRKKH